MASDVFQLLGRISVDTTEFTNRINTALTAVNNLATALNNLDGRTVNTNVNANTNNATNTLTNTQTAAQNTNPTQQNDDDNGRATTVVMPGSEGWTVGRGIATNIATDALRWLGQKGTEFMEAGWERNIQENMMTAKFETLLGIPYDEAAVFMDELNQFALDTPLDAPDTWEIARKMLNYGIPKEDILDEMQMLGDISMGSSTEMLALAKAYTETMGNNMLYGQEARQYINADAPIFSALEELYASDEYTGSNKGLTASEIKAKLNAPGDNGITVPFEDVRNAFLLQTSPGGRYYNAMSNMMNTPYGQQQRLGENLMNVSANVIKPFQDLYSKVISPSLLDFTEKAVEATERFSEISVDGEGTLIHQTLDALGIRGDVEYAISPFANLFGGISWEEIKGNASTFFSDWANLFSIVVGPHVSGDEEGANGGGGRRFGENPSDQTTDLIVEQKVLELLREHENTEDLPPDYESRRNNRHSEFGGSFADKLFFDDGSHLLPATSGLSSLLVELQNMPQQVTAAVQDGISGMTITANVSTGNVTLQDGTLVGALAPRINFILGAMNARSSRG